jgi:hypothetical protein
LPFDLHLLPILLILIRHSIKNILHQLWKVLAKQLKTRIRTQHNPSPTAAPRSNPNHDPNNIVPDSAERILTIIPVKLAHSICKTIDLERPLESLLDVPARYDFQGWDFEGSG